VFCRIGEWNGGKKETVEGRSRKEEQSLAVKNNINNVKVKVKLSLCFLTEHHAMEAY
jgi:hypothetical protein